MTKQMKPGELPPDKRQTLVTAALENQSQSGQNLLNLVRLTYQKLVTPDIVHFETMTKPTDEVRRLRYFHPNEMDIELNVELVSVSAIPRNFDTYLDGDADVVSSALAREIDREIIRNLLDYAWVVRNDTVHKSDSAEDIVARIYGIGVAIFEASLRGVGDWIVTTPEIAAKLSPLIKFCDAYDAEEDGLRYAGELFRLRVYVDSLPGNIVLAGRDPDNGWSGYVYCPYVPLTVVSSETGDRLMSRHGKIMDMDARKCYAKLVLEFE